ncbi:MAG: DUF4038 domain-containing protein [Pseudonocardia sp.]|nr:DUF4038 domain-containing protein [Pseudonocardia sp.]
MFFLSFRTHQPFRANQQNQNHEAKRERLSIVDQHLREKGVYTDGHERQDIAPDDRADKGFTVIQAVAVSPPSGGLGPNAQGDRPYHDIIDEPAVTDGADPDDDEQYDYWDHVEFVVAEAARRGMYVAMLPAWSAQTAGESLTEDTAVGYGRFLGARFAARYENLIGMAGGDDNEGFFPGIWAALAEGIAGGAGVDEDGFLMSYHPGGGKNSATEFDDAPWLDFHTHQSGHVPLGENGGLWHNLELSQSTGKAFLDSEPGYEAHPIDFDSANGYLDDLDVRQSAYVSVFSGAAGHTYGHHNVWMMYGTPGGGEGADPRDIGWAEALDAPGARQMAHLAALMQRYPGPREPAQDLLGSETAEGSGDAIVAARTPDAVLVYTAGGRGFELAADGAASWFDPRTGEYTAAEESGTFTPPTEGDWVLVVEDGGAQDGVAPTVAADAPADGPVRIMPLGDSITYGYSHGSYRTELYRQLTDAGVEVDFVGSQNDGPDDLPDADHEGHSGQRVDQLDDRVAGWLADTDPDIVLLHAGTNDLLQGDPPEQVVERLDALLTTLFAEQPGVTVITSSLIPLNDSGPDWQAVNAAIPDVVAEQRAAGNDAVFADMAASGIGGEDDIPDDVHPSPAGYAKMAEVWLPLVLGAVS